MSTKRRKQEAVAPQALPQAPAQLVTEVYECLMQASRRQLATLLATLVKSCSAAQLERVRDEATTSGALLPKSATPSRLQTATHGQLELVFGWLAKGDLFTAECVCARWRAACRDSGAGWRQWLTRNGRHPRWLPLLQMRRIRPESLSGLRHAECAHLGDEGLVRTLVRLPALTELHLSSRADLRPEDAALLQQLRGLRTVRFAHASQARLLLDSPCSASWESLRVDDSVFASTLDMLPTEAMPKLRELTLDLRHARLAVSQWERLRESTQLRALRLTHQRPDGVTLEEEFVESLARLTQLETLQLPDVEVADESVLQPLGRLTRLTALTLGQVEVAVSPCKYLTTSGCQFLSRLTRLTRLQAVVPIVPVDERHASGLDFMLPLQQLEHLVLAAWSTQDDKAPAGLLSEQHLAALRQLPRLATLELRGFGLSTQARIEWAAHRLVAPLPDRGYARCPRISLCTLRTLLSLPALRRLRIDQRDPDGSDRDSSDDEDEEEEEPGRGRAHVVTLEATKERSLATLLPRASSTDASAKPKKKKAMTKPQQKPSQRHAVDDQEDDATSDESGEDSGSEPDSPEEDPDSDAAD